MDQEGFDSLFRARNRTIQQKLNTLDRKRESKIKESVLRLIDITGDVRVKILLSSL
jgi:hypothetical protein